MLIVLLFFSILGGIFFSRSPVLVVTDPSFNYLYGPQRLRLRAITSSLELFRRVIPVPVAENAGPDLIALVVDGVSRSPRAVLFPYRYLDGAQAYKASHPQVPVLVTGAGSLPSPGTVAFVRTDIAADLYRAGLCAAVLMGETRGVLFFTDGTLHDQYREAF